MISEFFLSIHALIAEADGISDLFEQHFGVDPAFLSDQSRGSVDKNSWNTSQDNLSRLGSLFISVPEGCERVKANAKIAVRIFRDHYSCHFTHRIMTRFWMDLCPPSVQDNRPSHKVRIYMLQV